MLRFLILLVLLIGTKVFSQVYDTPDTLWTVDIKPLMCSSSVFTVTGDTIIHSANSQIHIRDAKTGKLLKANNDTYPIYCMAISPDGKTLATAGLEYFVTLWDVATGEKIGRLFEVDDPAKTKFRDYSSLDFSPDGTRLLAVAGKGHDMAGWVCFIIWDYKSGVTLFKNVESKDNPDVFWYRGRFSPDGKYFATSNLRMDYNIYLWDANTYKPIGFFGTWNTAHKNELYDITFSPDIKLLASCGVKAVAKIWDVETRQLIKHIMVPETLAYGTNVKFMNQQNNLIVSYTDLNWNVGIIDLSNYNVKYLYKFDGEVLQISKSDKIFTSDGYSLLMMEPTPTSVNNAVKNSGINDFFNITILKLNSIKITIKNIQNTMLIKPAIISLYNINGLKIDNLYNGLLQNEQLIYKDISKLSTGAYFVEIKIGNELFSKKFIKE
jgi:WD40 repeat protein